MKIKDLKEALVAMQNVDVNEIKQNMAKVSQAIAYETYAYNIYVAGFLDGYRKRSSMRLP